MRSGNPRQAGRQKAWVRKKGNSMQWRGQVQRGAHGGTSNV